PGQEITCYLSVWNYELTDEDVTVYIRLDDTELICSDPEFSYDEETGLHYLTLPNMAPGEEFDIEYTVKVKDDVQDQSLITTEGYVQIKNHKEPFENYISHLVDSTVEGNYLVENDPYFGKGDLGNIPIDRFVEYSVFYCNSTAEKADVRVSVILDENTEMSENSAAEYDPETGEYYWIAEAVPAGGKGYFVFHAAALRDALDAGIVTQRAYVQIGDGERIELRPVTNRVINVISIREIAPYVGTGQLGYVPCGSEITYEITVRNYKGTTVDAEVEVFMDESLSYVSTKPGNYKVNDESDDTYTHWDIQGLAPGAEVKIIFTARVKDNAAELISCSAFVRLGEDPYVESDAITNTTLEEQAPPAVEPPAAPTAAPTVAPSATPSAEEQKTSPPTGDDTPTTLYVMLLAVSALCAAAVQKRRRAK
ncbi:MAG: DUF11 domain-containing protein, partial [Clostridiales bacterium]|nr:DUF11 domain-containing protein [Candidatus Blautia equi]